MAKNLDGKKVAILVETGFEQEELTRPRQALENAGAKPGITRIGAKGSGWISHWTKPIPTSTTR